MCNIFFPCLSCHNILIGLGTIYLDLETMSSFAAVNLFSSKMSWANLAVRAKIQEMSLLLLAERSTFLIFVLVLSKDGQICQSWFLSVFHFSSFKAQFSTVPYHLVAWERGTMPTMKEKKNENNWIHVESFVGFLFYIYKISFPI